eukprot:CAMPEP_0117435948 /NCGR_PEP_ID=MMETSP0759-20121206/755_1 /TAXON_ID=63605 /ORGANISM="Percolomonas cosmopolitus, Strain WS" /LENGTH=170 /DNA_ID=CAMNT_0005227533 /DNA_START=501 /DNA_END=1010 /DNA_ORIENTATION=-
MDLCCGSGCLLITSLLELPSLEKAVGVDISENALQIARTNARRMLPSSTRSQVQWINADVFSMLQREATESAHGDVEPVDCIISNPPYIPSKDLLSLDVEVRDHEPHIALNGGETGLLFYQLLADHAHRLLNENGLIFVEFGVEQKESVMDMFEKSGHWAWVENRKDWSS